MIGDPNRAVRWALDKAKLTQVLSGTPWARPRESRFSNPKLRSPWGTFWLKFLHNSLGFHTLKGLLSNRTHCSSHTVSVINLLEVVEGL